MRTLFVLTIMLASAMVTCKSEKTTDNKRVDFGIFEIVTAHEMPVSIVEKLKGDGYFLESNPEIPVIAYGTMADSSIFCYDISGENFRFTRTYNTVDKDKSYYAFIAVKPEPFIENSHIRSTRTRDSSIEIRFNMEGAKKWAEMTRENIGNSVAITIGNDVYSMPRIGGEIRNGIAIIDRIESEVVARSISEALNHGVN